MRILDKNWLTDAPFDFELKRYKLLGAIQKIHAVIKGGDLFSALVEVEEQLEDLYKLKNQKNEIDDRLKVLKGINLDTMSLDYEYPDQDDSITHVYNLCDFAIDEFESVFRLIRAKWRGHSSKLKITEIPRLSPTKTKGIVFVINKNKDSISTYSYVNPYKMQGDWRDLILKDQELNLKSLDDMINFIELTDKKSSDNRYWRCDNKLSNSVDDFILPIITHSLYYKIHKY